jgi:hypothetical protein
MALGAWGDTVTSRPFYVLCRPEMTWHRKEITMSNQPAYRFKIGLITATIWNNDGFYSVDLTRADKTQDGDWRNTASFGHNDLLNLSKCAERTESWIAKQLAANT